MKAKDVLPGDVLSIPAHGDEIIHEVSITAEYVQLKLECGKDGSVWSHKIKIDEDLTIFRIGAST